MAMKANAFTANQAPEEPLPVIHTDSITHWFRELAEPTVVVDRFSLTVHDGEFVVLVGPSGCGKTTVLNMVAGLIAPELGTIRVQPPAGRAENGVESIGYMFARDALLPWRPLQRNVELGLEYRGVSRKERRQRAASAINRVGLAGYEGALPRQLSHGMRQRANLARLLVTSPSLVLLDEPFSALDAQTRLALQNEFVHIWEAERPSVLMVTHDLNEAAALADRIVIMRNGRVQDEMVVPFDRPRDVGALRFDLEFNSFLHELHLLFDRAYELAT